MTRWVSLKEFSKTYVEHTDFKATVTNISSVLGLFSKSVQRSLSFQSARVHITARTLKHMYDKRPAREYDVLIAHLPDIVQYPQRVYQNKSSKRGSYFFVKSIKNNVYGCPIEVVTPKEGDREEQNFVVTAFMLGESKRYLKKYKLIWDWKDGKPSS